MMFHSACKNAANSMAINMDGDMRITTTIHVQCQGIPRKLPKMLTQLPFRDDWKKHLYGCRPALS